MLADLNTKSHPSARLALLRTLWGIEGPDGEIELNSKGCVIKAFKSTSHSHVTTQGLRFQPQEESVEVRTRRLKIRENGIKQEYLEAKARGEEFTNDELHEVITELIQVGNELAKTENEVEVTTQEAVDKKVLELDMQHEVSRKEYLDKGASEEGIKLNDHLNFMEVTLRWTTEQMTLFRDAYLEEKQLRRSEVTVSSKETRVVVKAFRSHPRVQSTSQGSRDPPPPVEEVEELTLTVTGIQEALDARLAELKTSEVDLKQEYEDLKKVCNPIPEEDIHGFMFGLLKVGRERANAFKKAYESVLELHQKNQADKAMNEETSQTRQSLCCRRRREAHKILPDQRTIQE